MPDKFREVQWTHCPAGEVPGKFIDRVARLLSPDVPLVPGADSQARATRSSLVRQPVLRRRGLMGAVIVVAVLAVGGGFAYMLSLRSAAIGLIAVLPFENGTGDPANEYLSSGISESLINKLSTLSGLRIISRTSAFAFKDKKLGPIDIGKRLGVDALGKARTAATRALELDPNLAEAHTALGDIRWYFEWDWAGAGLEYRRGLALSPGSEAVHESYGAFLFLMDRLDEGMAESREAARLDPLSVQPFHDIAINALLRGDYEQATAGFRRTINIDPNWTWGYIKLGRTLAIQRKCKEAFQQAEIAERRIAGGAAPLSRSWLGATYATCGDVKRARQKLDELHAMEKVQYVDPVTFATIHSALGEMDEALHWYEKAYEDRTPNMAFALILPKISHDRRLRVTNDSRADQAGDSRPNDQARGCCGNT